MTDNVKPANPVDRLREIARDALSATGDAGKAHLEATYGVVQIVDLNTVNAGA